MAHIESEVGLVAELAFAAGDLQQFEREWLDHLQRSFGFETACSVWTTPGGFTLHAAALGYDEQTLRERFTGYMTELTNEEVTAFSRATPAIDTQVLTRARRESLTVYRELLIPARVSCFVTHVWHSRWGVFGVHMARCGSSSPFDDGDVARLEPVLSAVKLGQALLAVEHIHNTRVNEWWAEAWRLSGRERQVTQLAARGFSNPEIAMLLRVSTHTVRNQMVSVFRKAAVTSRAELVFAMNAPASELLDFERARRSSGDAWHAFLEARGLGKADDSHAR